MDEIDNFLNENPEEISEAIRSNEGSLDFDAAERLLYPRVNRYLTYLQDNVLSTNCSTADMPKTFFRDYCTGKRFLFKNIFHDKLVYEKEIDLGLNADDVLARGNRGMLKDDNLTNVYSCYIKDIDTIQENLSLAYGSNENIRINGLLCLVNAICYIWRRSESYNRENLTYSFNPPLDKTINFEAFNSKKEKKSITINIERGRCGKAIYKIEHFLHQLGLIDDLQDRVNKDLLDQIGGYSSRLKSNYSLKGTLCLSLAPMDFITCSDNSLGWSSCFSMNTNQGCNYGHSLAMLTAKNTFIAYVKTDDPYVLCPEGDLPEEERYASNKMLRAWVFADEKAITVDKQYPYNNEYFRKQVVQFVNEISNNYYDIDVNEENIQGYFDLNIVYDDGPFPISAVHNNDELLAIKYSNYYYQPDDSFYCFGCGDSISEDDYDGDNGFFCLSCQRVVYCSECGELVSEDEALELPDGSLVCQSCYNAYVEAQQEANDAAGENGYHHPEWSNSYLY